VLHAHRVLSASPSTNAVRRRSAACLALLLGAGCGDDAVVIPAPGGAAPDVGAPDIASPAPTPSSPALLVAVIVEGPDDRNVYVGAVPEVPAGELDYSRFLEFGSVDVYTSGGYVFVWDREPARMTRFSVNDDLSLREDATISFERYGATGGGENVFVSATRSYLLSPQLDTIVVWDPEAMQITGTMDIALPGPPGGTGGPTLSGNETFAHKGQLVGDKVIWQVVTVNWESNVIHHATTLAVVSATTDEPVRVIEDSRCAIPGFMCRAASTSRRCGTRRRRFPMTRVPTGTPT
jgi:hypothetical protein